MFLDLQDHVLATGGGELALMTGEVELPHQGVTYWLSPLIESDEGDENMRDHGR